MKDCFDRISARKAYQMTGISADAVRQRVARKLGDASEERERTKKRIMKKRLFLSALVAALMFATAAAANSPHLSKLFSGNTEIVQPHVQTEPITKKLGEFEVTVLESLSDETHIYLTVSVKGLTDRAKQLVQDESVRELLDPYIEGALGKERSGMLFNNEVDELATEDTICIVGDLNYPNPDRKPLIIRVDPHFLQDYYPAGTTVTETITVPMDNQIGGGLTITPKQTVTAHKTVIVNLPDAATINSVKDTETPVTINRVVVSQFGVWIDYTDPSRCCTLDGCFFMQMADGTIRTYNQLFALDGGGGGGENDDYTERGAFRELHELKEFKAFVIGTTAYPMDGGAPYTVTIDPKLKPFALPFISSMETWEDGREEAVSYYPVKQLCEKLGANYTWDAAKQTATVTYLGRTVTLPVGKTRVNWPGYNRTAEVTSKLVDGTLYSTFQLYNALCLSGLYNGDNAATTIVVP